MLELPCCDAVLADELSTVYTAHRPRMPLQLPLCNWDSRWVAYQQNPSSWTAPILDTWNSSDLWQEIPKVSEGTRALCAPPPVGCACALRTIWNVPSANHVFFRASEERQLLQSVAKRWRRRFPTATSLRKKPSLTCAYPIRMWDQSDPADALAGAHGLPGGATRLPDAKESATIKSQIWKRIYAGR